MFYRFNQSLRIVPAEFIPAVIRRNKAPAAAFSTLQKSKIQQESFFGKRKPMKAMIINKFGGPEVFEVQHMVMPQVGPDQMLVRVDASSVNPVDTKIRSGIHHVIAPAFPAILHSDVAGLVIDVGENVKRFRAGDEVYGCAGGFKGTNGALAEYMLVDPDLMALKPEKLSMVEAAALPLVGITAWEALFDRARLAPEQSVLIHGATGGVGHVALQLALSRGAKVYATASSLEKLKIAKELGAIPINYRKCMVQDYVNEHTAGKGFDVVMNAVGGPSLSDSFIACAPQGVVAAISSSGTYDLTALHRKGLTLHLIFMPAPILTHKGRKRHGEILEELRKIVNKGQVTPLIDKVFSFTQVGEAHARLESGEAIGKVGLLQDLCEEENTRGITS